ncbi:hypothetical protein GH714_027810 [Hevea brasiliensis]|uniref:Uncharacterized protein n=1 Tax=Hevea brasiliensis TaxID=3981 RepID=A0A6A6MEB7_HEVBR|nr:hypothetical protein GH714_027810 [Hevea brasiliensis]
MVDLQGMAGLVEEAERLIKRMPIEVDAVVWGALFVAGQIHGNLLMGEKATLKLLELDPSVSGIYVLLANMYREANMLERQGRLKAIANGVTVHLSCLDIADPHWENLAIDPKAEYFATCPD